MNLQEYAAALAASLREFGHFQKNVPTTTGVCIISNPLVSRLLTESGSDRDALRRGLADALGLDTDLVYIPFVLMDWSDSHPTAEVLAKLDEVAAA